MTHFFFDGIPDYAKDYLYYIRNIRMLSARTVNGYYIDLRLFFKFIADYKHLTTQTDFNKIDGSVVSLDTIRSLNLSDIYLFLNYVTEERANAAKCRSRKISSIRGFFKYLEKQALIDKNPTETLEVPKIKTSLPVYLSVEECQKLLSSIDGNNKERDLCIVTFFLHCGLRLSELVNVNLNDITDKRLRVTGKGNKQRELYLNGTCMAALNDYLAHRSKIVPKAGHENALFISRNRTRISNRMVQTLISGFLSKAGLDTDKYSTHKLRHTAATLMFQNGVDVRVLQDVLGHENLGTTQIYTHVKDKQIENAIASNPLNQNKDKDI